MLKLQVSENILNLITRRSSASYGLQAFARNLMSFHCFALLKCELVVL